jgi:hypothetical protein
MPRITETPRSSEIEDVTEELRDETKHEGFRHASCEQLMRWQKRGLP